MTNAIQWGDLVPVVTVISPFVAVLWWLASQHFNLKRDLLQTKLEFAEKYVSVQSMRDLEDRLVQTIERLGDRLDRVFEKRS